MRQMGNAPPQPMLNNLAEEGLAFSFYTNEGDILDPADGPLSDEDRNRLRRIDIDLTVELPHPYNPEKRANSLPTDLHGEPAQWTLNETAGEQGYALLLTLVMSALLLPLGTFALMQARVDLLIARHGRGANEIFYVAESGLEHALADLRLVPFFERLAEETDDGWDTGGEISFPFLKPPPRFFPSAPFYYEVTVKPDDPDHVSIVCRAFGQTPASQTVSASVTRSPTPFTPGTIYSTIDASGFNLGSDFQVSGIDSSGKEDPVPAITLPDENAGVEMDGFPDIAERAEELFRDPRAQPAVASENGALGSGLFTSRVSLQVERLSGRGLLAVDGDFQVSESLDFVGLVIVLGDVRFERGSTVKVRGALIQGGDGRRLELLGTGGIIYDSQTIADCDVEFPGLLPHRAIVTGWQQAF